MEPAGEAPLDEAGLREAHATLTRILGAIEEYVYTGEFLADDGYQVVFAGPCREQFLGLSIEAARTAIWRYYVHPDDIEIFDTAHDGARETGRLDVEYRLIGADGVLRWVRDRGRVREEGGRTFLDGSILDVTAVHVAREELQAARAEADRLAHLDHLTGTANRRSLGAVLARREGDRCLGLLSVDLDHFKQVNDLFGHAAGDAVLVAVAERLRSCVRAGDTVLRMGGEEFLIVLRGIEDEGRLLAVAEDVRGRVEASPVVAGHDVVSVTVSVGAALVPDGPSDAHAMLSHADRALYQAKSAGRNRVRLASAGRSLGAVTPTPADSAAMRVARAMAVAAAASEGLAAEHLEAVSDLAAMVAHELGRSAPEIERCRLAGLVHDVGKLRVPAAVLTKPGPLDSAEWEVMRAHAVDGEALVRAVPELRAIARIVRHHHERWDGTGYPDGLAGDEIPLEARVVAVVDAWSAMGSDRSYRRALSRPAALAELDRVAGAQLDPGVVRALRAVLGAGVAQTAAA